MAHICFVSTLHNVHDHRFLYKECAGLVRAGHQVSFMVPHDRNCVLRGVTVIAHKPWKYRWQRFLKAPLMIGKMIAYEADAYHLCNIELLPVGLIVKFLTRRCVVYDNHEDFASFMLIKSYLPRPIAYLAKWTVQFLEWVASRTLDGFVAADPDVAAGYPALPEKRNTIFYNVPPLSMFPPNPIPWSKRKYDTVFLGSMSVTSGTLVLLDAFAELKQRGRPVKTLFIGRPKIPNFEKELADRDITENVDVTGRLDYVQVPERLNQCRIGLIGLLDLPKFRKNIATKMFEYWAKGMPVISADLPPERRLLTPGEHGLLVEPGNAGAFADAIASLLDDPDRGERMSRAVRRLVEDKGYYAEKEMARLAEFYDWLLKNPR